MADKQLKVNEPIKRSSGGLVDALFASIDRLNRNEITPEAARAISHTAKTIVGIANLELEYRKFAAAAEKPGSQLGSLTIDVPADSPIDK